MNKLFDLFGVKSHKELMDFIKKNPEDNLVKEIKGKRQLQHI